MSELVNIVPKEYWWLAVMLITAYFVLMYFPKSIMSWNGIKKNKAELIKEALNYDFLNEETKAHFQNQLEAEYFKLTTGIVSDTPLRLKILEIINKSKGEAKLLMFKRAMRFISFRDGVISFTHSKKDKRSAIVNNILAMLLFFLCLGFTAVQFGTFIDGTYTVDSVIFSLFFIPYLFWMAAVFLIDAQRYFSAVKLEEVVRRLELNDPKL
jgi:hypothetical protein